MPAQRLLRLLPLAAEQSRDFIHARRQQVIFEEGHRLLCRFQKAIRLRLQAEMNLLPGIIPDGRKIGDDHRKVLRHRALIILASDLFDASEETLKVLAQLRAQKHGVSVLHVLDPHETTFPFDGLTQFEALESTNKMLVNPAAIRREYR